MGCQADPVSSLTIVTVMHALARGELWSCPVLSCSEESLEIAEVVGHDIHRYDGLKITSCTIRGSPFVPETRVVLRIQNGYPEFGPTFVTLMFIQNRSFNANLKSLSSGMI